MISTHFRQPHRPSERELRLTDLYARQGAEMIERKRVEAALRRSKAHLAEGQRISHTGSWVWNVSSGELFSSQEHLRIFGIDPEKVKPSYEMIYEILHPEDRSRVKQGFEKAVHERNDFDATYRIICPNGMIKHIHSLSHPVFNESGDLTEYIGTVIDITERKRAEEKLVESERRFRLLVESIPHHIWSFRPDGSVGYWNQRLIDYTGLTVGELLQGGWAALHPDDMERVKAAWEDAWARGTMYEMEQRLRGRDGRYRRFVCRGVPVKDEQGRSIEWLGTDTDVEDRRRAEEALHESQIELARVTRVTTMGELAASIAHEVNQPLGAIVTNGHACLRLLSPDAPDINKLREIVEHMISDGLRASEVIWRIRALLKKADPEKSLLNINETIQEVIALTYSELSRNEIRLQIELARDLPPVLGDRVQLQQVILNLILNGKDAMNAAGWQPRELLITTQGNSPGEVLVVVRDSGTGIDPRDCDRIFDPFFTTKSGGMGLGLSISRTIIESHGGRLWATPNEEKGITIRFSLPA